MKKYYTYVINLLVCGRIDVDGTTNSLVLHQDMLRLSRRGDLTGRVT